MFHRTRTSTRSARPAVLALTTVTAIAAAVLFAPMVANAAEPGDDDFLGTAEDYAIIASDEITETATNGTVVTGDVALTTGTDQQLLVVQVSGDIHVTDTAAAAADLDLNTAYVIVANTDATDVVGTVNLAARVTPYGAGVYFSGSDLLLDGIMVLDGGIDDVFIFQASTGQLSVTSGSQVQLTGAVQACNVYWQVGSSATLGVNSNFVGTILAATSISAEEGAVITGQLLAGATNAGAVTLDDNIINAGSPCVRITSTQRVLAETIEADRVEAERLAALAAARPALLAETGVETVPLTIGAVLLTLGGVAAVIVSRRSRTALEG
ncbi:ice-binding family protein [Pseudolysinimonas sp.]|uniref:ice-binding family protein n=1 Tax=Pseudolysinimonas sp. TaxID=2680009 RepID=UPI003782E65C